MSTPDRYNTRRYLGTFSPNVPLLVILVDMLVGCRRAGLVQAVESYCLWPEGPGFESRSSRIAQARLRLATDTLPQIPHRAGALYTGSFFMLVGCYEIYSLHHLFQSVLKSDSVPWLDMRCSNSKHGHVFGSRTGQKTVNQLMLISNSSCTTFY